MPCFDEEKDIARNYIVETVKSLDRMQKEIILDNLSDCVTCETSLITRAFNTVPIILYMCNGEPLTVFSAVIPTPVASNLFRIECVRDSRFVTLRLLNNTDGVLSCSNQTCICDLDCVCALQCLTPINCEACTQE